MNKLTFLVYNQLYFSNKLNFIDKIGTKSAVTDFSILLGGWFSDLHFTEKVIDLKVFSLVESSILGRMKKIRNEVQNNRDDDLTIGNFHGNIASS